MTGLSPKREGIAAIYFYGGLLLWAGGMALVAAFSWWFLVVVAPSVVLIPLGMSGGPWRV